MIHLFRWQIPLREAGVALLFRSAAWTGDVGMRLLYRLYFGILYRRRDPWRYDTARYEIDKYDRTLDVVAAEPVERALEAGCSEGSCTERLLRRGLVESVVGVDVTEAALARARERCAEFPNARFERHNLAYDAPAGVFDLILCGETLYYLGGKSDEACRVLADRLAPGGRIVAVHPRHLAGRLHAPWRDDPRLRVELEQHHDERERPYTIECFRRVA